MDIMPALTSMVSVICPTVSLGLKVIWEEILTSIACFKVLKPARLTVRVYWPMGTFSIWYRPEASLTVSRGLGSVLLSARMVAPGTGAPLSSTTTPEISPVRSWA